MNNNAQSSKRGRNSSSKKKKITLKDAATKVVDAIKKPFVIFKKTKEDKKAKVDSVEKDSSAVQDAEVQQEPLVDEQFPDEAPDDEAGEERDEQIADEYRDSILDDSLMHLPMNSGSKFFYTNDAFFQQIDDQSLYKYVVSAYPDLDIANDDMHAQRNALIDMLNDIKFMEELLEMYDITAVDFFKFMFRVYPQIFKGLFVKKLQQAVKKKKYARTIQKSSYTFTKNIRKPKRRKAASRGKKRDR